MRVYDRDRDAVIGWPERWRPPEVKTGKNVDVLLLGDSQVETSRPFEKRPEVLLNKALDDLLHRDVEVVSVSSSGWGQDQQLEALKRTLQRFKMLKIKTGIVCLWFCPINDFFNNTYPTDGAKHTPKPTYWLQGDRLMGPHVPWLNRHSKRRLQMSKLVDSALRIPTYETNADWESRLPASYKGTKPVSKDMPLLSEFIQQKRKEHLYVLPYINDMSLFPPSPRMLYSVKLTRALLSEIYKECVRHGVAFMIFYQVEGLMAGMISKPAIIPEEPTDFLDDGLVLTLSAKSARKLMDETVAGFDVLRISGLPPRPELSNIDKHLDDKANEYVMLQLAKALIQKIPHSGD